jgi:hypothetical protein
LAESASVRRVELALVRRRWRATVVDAPAPGKGQDRWLACDGVAVIADGATPLTGHADDPGPFAAALVEGLAGSPGVAARRRLGMALQSVAAERAASGVSATLGAVVETPAGLRALVLGDCQVIWFAAGRAHIVEDKRLGRLDERAMQALRRHIAAGGPPEVSRESIGGLLARNRSRLNTPTGYWVATPSQPDAASHAIVRIVPDDCEAVLLASDGFARLWTVFGLADPSDLVGLAPAGIRRLVGRLRDAERRAAASPVLAQLSVSDDATAILLTRADAS